MGVAHTHTHTHTQAAGIIFYASVWGTSSLSDSSPLAICENAEKRSYCPLVEELLEFCRESDREREERRREREG